MSTTKYERAKEWRRHLHEGRGVAICNMGNHKDRYSIGTVERCTATQLIVSNHVGYSIRFNRETGRQVGTGRMEIEEITPEIRAMIKEASDRREFGNLAYRPDNLPADEIAVMLEALKTYRATKEAQQSEH